MYQLSITNLDNGRHIELQGNRILAVAGPLDLGGASVVDSMYGFKILEWDKLVDEAIGDNGGIEITPVDPGAQTLFEAEGLKEDGTPLQGG